MEQKDRASKQKDRASILREFEPLPDEALCSQRVAEAVLDASGASLWRWVGAGLLAAPRRVGKRSTRWTAGQLRLAREGVSK